MGGLIENVVKSAHYTGRLPRRFAPRNDTVIVLFSYASTCCKYNLWRKLQLAQANNKYTNIDTENVENDGSPIDF